MKTIKIGCCGFPVGRRRYYNTHKVVELQNTFYDIPSIEWAEKIRKEAPLDFEFVVKAWQVITHPSRSPTWRRLKKKPEGKLENYGWMKPTRENLDALRKVVEFAQKLNSKIIVLQTPASMPFNDDAVNWVEEFFEKANELTAGEVMLGWEPRGRWAENQDVLEKILSRHSVVHVVDIFKRRPVSKPNGLLYTRLHGVGKGEVNYKYKYTDKDLEELVSMLREEEFTQAYVMFNNVFMLDDSIRLKEKLAGLKEFNVI